MRGALIKGCGFAALIFGFWLLGGFEVPSDVGTVRGRRAVQKAWVMTMVLFVAGAVFLVWADDLIDYFASAMPPPGLRIIGAMLVIAGALWSVMLNESLK